MEMADVFDWVGKKDSKKPNKILQWYDTMHNFQQTKALDQAINLALAGLMIVTTFTFAAQFLVTRPSVVYDAMGNCTVAVSINHSHTKNRMLQKVTFALKQACDHENDVNIGTQVYINNVSSQLDIFHLCERNEVYENPKILKVGSHVGKCSETYGNVTKTKKRFFPVVVRSGKKGKSKTFYTLKDSCAVHSAIERLKCSW